MTYASLKTRLAIASICAAVLVAAGAAPHLLRSADASTVVPTSKVDERLAAATGDVRVYLSIAGNDLANDLAKRQAAQLARQSRISDRARTRATANPYLLTEQELRAAKAVESHRSNGLPALRRAAEPDARANERVAALIKHGGGEVQQSSPLPNSITASVPARLIPILSRSALVASIEPAGGEPFPMNSPVDGSETWHQNGLTGDGDSVDGNGGPDFVAIDAGIRTTHLAFRTRLPDDPPDGPATGPSRITSPAGRTFFGGSEHGNTVAATVANTDLTQPVWPYYKGLAYGIDKVYDPYQAQSGFFWLTGIAYAGEPGVTDLPEAANYSSGLYEDTSDFNPVWIFIDDHIASFGITYSISGGNCGVEGGGYTGCSVMGQGPHRVSTPGNLHNTITLGGLDYNGEIYNSTVWTPWANSSPGPTWGGRKKPDLIFEVTGGGGTPSQLSDAIYENAGEGTSFAAPSASAGALLLASTGVYQPTAQKAILINTATPIQGQTYWTPRSGWGALNLDAAFHQRANYANGTITGSTDNGVRFFRATGIAPDDRSTVIWNRRTATASTYHPLTNLDLSQHDQATGASTATGGSDAADTVDTNQVVSTDNPMPGSGTDGGDNVEQVRSTSSGTQVLKVKAHSEVTGLAAEPFSIASAKPLTTLETPVPTVELDIAPASSGVGDAVVVTATVTNTSSDIALTDTSVTLNPPENVSITTGSATQALGTLGVDAAAVAVWQVVGDTGGVMSLAAEANGTAYGEIFNGEDAAELTIDGTPPVVAVNGPGQWSAAANPTFSWGATDDSDIASYNVSTSINDGPTELVLANTTSTASAFTAPEGAQFTVFVTAQDAVGNESAPVSASTIIDAVAPVVAVTPTEVLRGRATATVTASNVGSPITLQGVFSTNASAPLIPLSSHAIPYLNGSRSTQRAIARATATDALGRVASAAAAVDVPSRFSSARLKLGKPSVRKRKLRVAGKISRSARGRVTIKITRIGRVGTKRKVIRATIRSGKFSARTKLRKGRYRIHASYRGSSSILKSSDIKTSKVN
ncbi:MAG: hypothetical protein ACPGYP_07515 [Solirubrobacterales bacterium]